MGDVGERADYIKSALILQRFRRVASECDQDQVVFLKINGGNATVREHVDTQETHSLTLVFLPKTTSDRV